MLERWTHVVIRGRILVIALWIAVIIVGTFAAVRLPALLSTSLAVPGSDSGQADAILTQHFGENVEGTFTVVFRVSNPPAATLRSMDNRFSAAAGTIPTAHVMALREVAGILYGNISTALDLQRAATYTGALRHALKDAGLPAAYVTGAPALQYDIEPILTTDLHRGEVIAVLAALALLTFVLGPSVALLIPLAVAAGTTTAALAIIFALAHEFLMVLYVPNLVQLIGLGIAVDYSLLVVHRFKHELSDEERAVEDAIAATMTTAGRTVVFSGIAVAVGLSAVLIVPVPFVRSLGFAGLVVPLVSIVAALTLQPALLSLLGRRGMGSVRLSRPKASRDLQHGLWSRLAALVMRRPIVVLACSAGVLFAAATPALWLELTPGSVVAIPQSIQSARALSMLRDRIGPGVITPIEVVLDAGAAGKADAPAISAATLRLAHELLNDPEVFVVAIGSRAPYIDSSDRYRQMIIIGRHDFGQEATQLLVHQIHSRFLPGAHFPPGLGVYVGGAPAQGADFLTRVYGTFPWIVLLVLALAYLVLLPRVPVPRAAVDGRGPRRDLRCRHLRTARRDLPLRGRGRRARPLSRLPDRGLGADLPLRDALRPLDGLRGLLRHAHARVVGRPRRQPARRVTRAHPHRAGRQRRGLDHGRGTLGAGGRTCGRVAGDRQRARARGPHRRDDRARPVDAESHDTARTLELVAPGAHRPGRRGEGLASRWTCEARPTDKAVTDRYLTTVMANLNAGKW